MIMQSWSDFYRLCVLATALKMWPCDELISLARVIFTCSYRVQETIFAEGSAVDDACFFPIVRRGELRVLKK